VASYHRITVLNGRNTLKFRLDPTPNKMPLPASMATVIAFCACR
jgi:hypothetical protein